MESKPGRGPGAGPPSDRVFPDREAGDGRQGDNREPDGRSAKERSGHTTRPREVEGRLGTGVLERPAPVPARVGPADIRVLFVAGYGRSGSTVLDVLLHNAGPHIFGAGELRRVFEEFESGARCSCGRPYDACEFWPGVIRRAASEPERNGRPSWRELFEAVSVESGASVVVDSSKTNIRTYPHLLRLARSGLDVRILHLIRDPRAVMWSVHRGSNEALEAGREPRLRGGMARGLLGWTLSNLLVERLCRKFDLPILRVRYEDLIGSPIEQLSRIGEFGGLDTTAAVRKLVDGEALAGGHGVSGNRMRRQDEIRLSADSEWRARLPLHGRLLGILGWPLARRYGYRLSTNGREA